MKHIEREVLLEAPVREVWTALTDQDLLSAWFGADVEMLPGGAALFRWPDGSARRAVVDVSDEPKLLVLRWLPFEHDPAGRTRPKSPAKIVFTLAPRAEGTLLRVVETDAPDFVRDADLRTAQAR
jgi:uncharacterized protein YndB with AHSA1/START domain